MASLTLCMLGICEFPVTQVGAQWLSGRVLDLRPRGCGFEPRRHHWVVVMSEHIYPSLVLVQPRMTCPCLTERLLMGRKESNQTKTVTQVSGSASGTYDPLFSFLSCMNPCLLQKINKHWLSMCFEDE